MGIICQINSRMLLHTTERSSLICSGLSAQIIFCGTSRSSEDIKFYTLFHQKIPFNEDVLTRRRLDEQTKFLMFIWQRIFDLTRYRWTRQYICVSVIQIKYLKSSRSGSSIDRQFKKKLLKFKEDGMLYYWRLGDLIFNRLLFHFSNNYINCVIYLLN